MRRGLLGGTFDPVHNGHLMLAQEVLWRLGLDQVCFVPTSEPWMKASQLLTSKEHRRAMVELAIAADPRLTLNTIELDRLGETYTVDTLKALRDGPMRDDELLFIMGEDALHTMHRWKEVARILELARLVVALRPGQGPLDFSALEAIDPTMRERVMTVQMPLIEISGTELRRRAAAGEPIRYLVPTAVEEYIERNGLYR